MSKVTKDQYIEDLEEDMGTLTDIVTKLKEDKYKLKQKVKKYKILYKTTRKDLKDLVERTPSKHLFESKDSDYSKPEWTPKQIAHWDKMIKQSIKETQKGWEKPTESERSDEWRIEQFNRNRAPEEQVSNIQEMSDRVSDMFDTKYIYESPDGGKTIYRREMGKSKREAVNE